MSEISRMTLPLKFVNHNIEDFAIQVTYDPVEGEGKVVYNLSLIKNEDLEYAISILRDANKTGVSFSGMVRFFSSGEKVADFVVPKGCTGICTMCSITFDGLLIRRGIPINPIGGGVVEIEDRTPVRFTHIILYEHTTIDPLQVLISQKTTSVINVMRRGVVICSQISASFIWRQNPLSAWYSMNSPAAAAQASLRWVCRTSLSSVCLSARNTLPLQPLAGPILWQLSGKVAAGSRPRQ